MSLRFAARIRSGLFLVLVAFAPWSLFGQSILTYAGGGPLGDGKQATEATLSFPWDVTVAPNGDIYIADSINNLIRKIDSSTGVISTVAGGGTSGPLSNVPGTQTQLSVPTSVAVDSEGTLYVADQGHFRICRIDTATGLLTNIGGGGPGGVDDDGIPAIGASMLPMGLEFDSNGDLFYADSDYSHRVRKIDMKTGLLTTIAGDGTPGTGGDGGPATQAQLETPRDIAFDSHGDLYIIGGSEPFAPWGHVRRVDIDSGIISSIDHEFAGRVNGITASGRVLYLSSDQSVIMAIDLDTMSEGILAGTGDRSFSGDEGEAGDAAFSLPWGLEADRGTLFIADGGNNRIRMIDGLSRRDTVHTIAGGGPVGDGGPATAATISVPTGIALTPSGGLIIGSHRGYRLRLVDPRTRVISTIAGDGINEFAGDGGAATEARLREVVSVETDSEGNIYLGTEGRVRKIDAETGIIATVVGDGSIGYGGDGGPATEALVSYPYGLVADAAGNLFIADVGNFVIRRVDAETRVIETIAGNGSPGYSGDGGPAREASLGFFGSAGLALDADSNLYIPDFQNQRVRRVDSQTGIITTVAGNGAYEWTGDGGPATQSGVRWPKDVAVDGLGNLYIAEVPWFGVRIRRVDALTGNITTVAGGESGSPGGDYHGDGGPATEAGLSYLQQITVDASGNIFASEFGRVRAIFACREINPPGLDSPQHGAFEVPTAPTLTWQEVEGAFRYDVLLNKEGEPGVVVASDLTTTSFTPQNLEEGATYFWQIRAKGDPFCEPVAEGLSGVRSFTVISPCDAPQAPRQTSPPEGFVVEDVSATLTWDPVPRASRYDIHLGTTLPPPFFRSTTGTTMTTPRLITGNTYYWSIVAHASCDTSLTTQSEVRSFYLSGPCNPAGDFDLLDPAAGASEIPTTTTLSWSPSVNATSYDLYLGTTNPPQILLPAMRDTSVKTTGFDPNRTYYWRVKAAISCDDSKSLTSEIRSFTTQDTCERPQRTSIIVTPPGDVGIGQTYAIAWNAADGLDSGGTYVVERSLDPSFSSILDSQELTGTTATFVAESSGIHYHRVRPVPRCDVAISGPNSESASVTVVDESANIIFTIEPEAVINPLGRNLEDLRTTFALENISNEPVSAIVGRGEIDSVPFFNIVDPLGGNAVFVTLQPREPKTFEVHFSGPPNDVEAAYRGLIVVTTLGSPVIPYAFVNLKVGDQGTSAPEFRIGGTQSEYTFFPGLDGDDTSRPPITIEIHNPGPTPMELGAEIGPEVWLEPEAGWNDTPIPAGASRSVELITRRNRAFNGSALPRYTYFTVRTKTGETARMLVQDNAAASLSQGRTSALDQDTPSLIIPEVVSEQVDGGSTLVSRVRLTNLGSDPVQVELVFTPTETDGFSSSVQRAIVVVPDNDVATLTDPLVQIFGLSRPAAGQIEVRTAGAKLGQLAVESSLVSVDTADSVFVRIPTVQRNEGARLGSPHQIAGITANGETSTRLTLAETSGTDGATVTLTLYDSAGSELGSGSVALERYGHLRINDLVTSLGGTVPLSTGRLLLTVTGDGGSVLGLARIEDAEGERASVLQSSPLDDGIAAKRIRWSNRAKQGSNGQVTATLVAPYVASGQVDETGVDWATVMGFQAPFGTRLDFTVTFTDSSGTSSVEVVSVLGGAIVKYDDVLKQLFGIEGATKGSIVIEADPRGLAYARLTSGGLPAGAFALVSSISELVTMASSSRPLFVDGVEQSTDSTRGTRWNLYLREIAGQSGSVTIRLYEAGNRTHPIAIKDFSVGASGQLSLETIFDAMDLNTDSRRKDRTNVLVMLTPKSGNAQIAGIALEIDNRTGSATPHTLQPASGLPASGVTTTLVRVVGTGSSQRRRPVRRGD